jgi:hypothetical protein
MSVLLVRPICRGRCRERLELKLQADLAYARIAGIGDQAKHGTIDIATRSQELSVVEDVKELRAELQVDSFRQMRIFQQSHVPVVGARIMEETAVGGAFDADGAFREQ